MSFLHDIFLGQVSNEQVVPCNYRAEIYSGEYAYFENVKGLKSFSDNKVELFLKRGVITVTGRNLFLKKYGAGDVCIGGDVNGFKVDGD